ncbi:MAG TPA: hypothetical protein VFT56_08105 [Sphingomonas sp.]|nr:hypothetical protein [Sphingomonas sp.]
MNVGKVLLGAGAVVGLLSSTVAMATTTRSAAALPSVQAVNAPVNGVRASTTLRHKSSQSDESAAGTYIVGGLAAAAVIAGIVVVASDDNNNPSSAG